MNDQFVTNLPTLSVYGAIEGRWPFDSLASLRTTGSSSSSICSILQLFSNLGVFVYMLRTNETEQMCRNYVNFPLPKQA